MTIDEAIKFGENILLVADKDDDETAIEFTKMAIKALKQYGALQEIRKEIEKPLRDERCYDTADAKAQYIALNWVCELIDKHIKEIEE